MSHDRDHDHPTPAEPREVRPPHVPASNPKPDRPRSERPSIVPREPVDPRTHPK
jgi:hypothetical protein